MKLFADVCKMDVVLKPDELIFLKKEEVPAIYILFVKKEAMYVGQSKNVYNRVTKHLRKHTASTSSIANEIDEIGLQFVKEPLTNEPTFLEMAYMYEFNPPLNIKRNKWIVHKMLERHFKERCRKCNFIAHQNGLCKSHGGNGVTFRDLAKQELDNMFTDEIQLKFII